MAGWICHADCSGLEPRIIADRTDCKVLLDIFRDPATSRKVYVLLGKEILGRTIKKPSEDYDLAKEIILATNYNAMWGTLQRRLAGRGIYKTDAECQYFIRRYFSVAPELKDYIWEQRRAVVRDQAITCLTGWTNELPNEGPDAREFKHVWNQAVNVEIQHTASMIGVLWMNFVQRLLRKEGLTKREVHALHTVLLGPVHDSVTHDARTKTIGQRVLAVYEEALQVVQGQPMVALIGRRLKVPLEVDVTMAENWGACK